MIWILLSDSEVNNFVDLEVLNFNDLSVSDFVI